MAKIPESVRMMISPLGISMLDLPAMDRRRLHVLGAAEKAFNAGQQHWLMMVVRPAHNGVRKVARSRAFQLATIDVIWPAIRTCRAPRITTLRVGDEVIVPIGHSRADETKRQLRAELRLVGLLIANVRSVDLCRRLVRFGDVVVTGDTGEFQAMLPGNAWRDLGRAMRVAPHAATALLSEWLLRVSPALMFLEFEHIAGRVADLLPEGMQLHVPSFREAWFTSIELWRGVRRQF